MKISILCVTLAILPLCLSAEILHIPDANLERDEFIAANPNAVFLMHLLEMRDASIDYWGKEFPYWVRDSAGNIVFDGGDGGRRRWWTLHIPRCKI
ncbi:MAG: hypothetical protein OXN17_08280 [Candidatus Poribacteria bacterium]|nr:hypothetical protein [Candidatus Poribacteria bacterium]MDE0505610.1 hypothetical protein [Candidatus Poribacteria bacterium]